ncbi:MAG: hypothetical protein LLG20_22725 [Acidobacteriales bacterium]|nr:hypothetical protein [Terriglobales bacterium]
MTHQQVAANYSDRALAEIARFFRKHPSWGPRDKEWAEARKAAVKAEIERREREDKEALQ